MIGNSRQDYNERGLRDTRGNGRDGVSVGNYQIQQNGDVGINLGGGSVISPNGNVEIKVGAIMFNGDGSMSTNFGLG